MLRWTSRGELVSEKKRLKIGPARHLSYSAGADRLAILGEKGDIRVVDATNLRVLSAVKVDPPADEFKNPFHVAISADGTKVATADGDRKIRIWEASSGRPIGVEALDVWRVERLLFERDFLVAYGGDSSTLALEWRHQGEVRRWNPPGGSLVAGAGGPYWIDGGRITSPRWSVKLPYGGGQGVVSPTGRLLAMDTGTNWVAGSMNHTVVLDTATGRQQVWMHHPAWRIQAQVWWKEWLILGGIRGYLGVFDPSTGRRVRSLSGHLAEVIDAKVFRDQLFTLDSAGNIRSCDLSRLAL